MTLLGDLAGHLKSIRYPLDPEGQIMILGRLLDFHNGPTHSSLHVRNGTEWSLHAVRPSNGHVTKIQRCPQLLPQVATLF